MTPFELLKEECASVKVVLNETLRFDYGPPQSAFYKECSGRYAAILAKVAALSSSDLVGISDSLRAIRSLGTWIALIERSHLGEFSWPFSKCICTIAEHILAETVFDEKRPPILHIISEGTEYQVLYEDTPQLGMDRRIAIVVFPRHFKHYVLYHALFGHELAHAASATAGGDADFCEKMRLKIHDGPLSSPASFGSWISDAEAPQFVKEEHADFLNASGLLQWQISQEHLDSWKDELACDLVGLMMFGPAFAAAHRALLEPASPIIEIGFDQPTHPPFAVRRRMLANAMKALGWDQPILDSGPVRAAEQKFIKYIMGDESCIWSDLLSREQLAELMDCARELLGDSPLVVYKPLDGEDLTAVIKNLTDGSPPRLCSIDLDGIPDLQPITVFQILYGGWVFWLGREYLDGYDPTEDRKITFLQVNRLCDHALMQQQAVDIAIKQRASLENVGVPE